MAVYHCRIDEEGHHVHLTRQPHKVNCAAGVISLVDRVYKETWILWPSTRTWSINPRRLVMFIVTSFGLAFASLLGLLFPFLSQTVLGIPEELSSGYNRHHARGDNITSELSTYIREMMDTFNITGLVAGIVPKDGVPDLKAWGYISENGEETTPDVSASPIQILGFHDLAFARPSLAKLS